MRRTWYIVQTARNCFVQPDEVMEDYAEGWGMENAAQFPTLGRARQVCHDFGGRRDGEGKRGARRFPRIIKITQETKTIKEG